MGNSHSEQGALWLGQPVAYTAKVAEEYTDRDGATVEANAVLAAQAASAAVTVVVLLEMSAPLQRQVSVSFSQVKPWAWTG